MTISLEVHSPVFSNTNRFVANSSDAFSNSARLYTHLIIDKNTDSSFGVQETVLLKDIKNHFGNIKFQRDVFIPLSSTFLDKEWGIIHASNKKEMTRWVSTPLGNPIGDFIREQIDGVHIKKVREMSEKFQILNHESRVAVIKTLHRKGSLPNDEITKIIFPRSSIGFHLEKLRQAGVIDVEPENCDLKKNQLPTSIFAGKNIEFYNDLIQNLTSATKAVPPIEKYPLWYFMHNLQKPRTNLLDAVKLTLPILTLAAELTAMQHVTKELISTLIEKFDLNSTVKDFLEKDVRLGYIENEGRIIGIVTKERLKKDLESLPVEISYSTSKKLENKPDLQAAAS